MRDLDPRIVSIIEQYRMNLEVMGVHVRRLILYGSQAAGRAREDSDIDLMVVSDDLAGMDLWERLALLGRARMGIGCSMEIEGITEEEVKNAVAGSFLAEEILSKGIYVG